jgi:hypothetical protein
MSLRDKLDREVILLYWFLDRLQLCPMAVEYEPAYTKNSDLLCWQLVVKITLPQQMQHLLNGLVLDPVLIPLLALAQIYSFLALLLGLDYSFNIRQRA